MCAPGRAGDRRLVRLGLHAGRPGRATRTPPGSAEALRLPGRLHLRGHRPDARLVLLAAGHQHARLRREPRTATSSAWATSSTPTGARCPSRSATSSTRGRSSTRGAPTPCAGGCSARARRGRRRGRRSARSTRAMRDMLLTLWNTFSFFTTYASLNGFDPADPADPGAGRARRRSTAGSCRAWPAPRPTVTDGAGRLRAPGRRRPRWAAWSTTSPTGTCAAAAAASGAPIPTRPPGDTLAAQATLHEVLTTLSLLLAPFCPFVADAMWRAADRRGRGSDSVHLADWPARRRRRCVDLELEAQMALARRLTSLGPGRPQRGRRSRCASPSRGRWCSCRPARPRSSRDIVADELNVDEVDTADELSEVHPVRAGRRTSGRSARGWASGPGGSRPALAALDGAAAAAALEAGRPITVDARRRAGRARRPTTWSCGSGASRASPCHARAARWSRWTSTSTTGCASAGWPATSCAWCRTCARRAGSRSPTGSGCTSSASTHRRALRLHRPRGAGGRDRQRARRGRGHAARPRRRAAGWSRRGSGCRRWSPDVTALSRLTVAPGSEALGSPGSKPIGERDLDAPGGGRVQHDEVGVRSVARPRRHRPVRRPPHRGRPHATRAGACTPARRPAPTEPGRRCAQPVQGQGAVAQRHARQRAAPGGESASLEGDSGAEQLGEAARPGDGVIDQRADEGMLRRRRQHACAAPGLGRGRRSGGRPRARTCSTAGTRPRCRGDR